MALQVAPAARSVAERVIAAAAAQWGGIPGIVFRPDGVFQTPWNEGRWGALPDKPGLLFADFGGAMHELTFGAWPAFTSTRCSDGEVVHGKMVSIE